MDCDGAVRPAQACPYRRSRSARRPFIVRRQSARPARGALDGSRAELAVITEQRLGLARLLEGLSDDEWEQPSLCAGWRVRDVAAHVSLVALPPSPGSVLVDILRARGNFHRLNTMASRRRAERSPNQLIADLRQHAGSRKIPVVSDQRNVLFDLLVHVQDIAIPLGIDLPMPVVPAAAGATRVWSMGWPFWARRQLRGLRLRATDTDWSAGAGAE